MAVRSKKQTNIFEAYFKDFGLKQICDILIFAGAIVLIVGLCVSETVIIVGLGMYIAASLIAIVRSLKVLTDKNMNKRSPEYKRALINAVIMGVIFALSIFGLIYAILT